MNLEWARQILNISEDDDKTVIKKKYRQLMGYYHPDVLGSDRPEHIKRAQEINEAYYFLKNTDNVSAQRKNKRKWKWSGVVNKRAFCDRNIYLYYSMQVEGDNLYYQTARGKYMWNPDEEEFSLFITSIHHAVKELLEKIEERIILQWCDDAYMKAKRFEIQAQIFHCLTQQFIDPVKTLRKIAKPEITDKIGRAIYHFQASLGTKGYDQIFKEMERLKSGDVLYPESFQGNKILVCNQERQSLGHLSFDEDCLYVCIIPLLKKKLARIKMVVNEVEISRRSPYRVKVDIDFYFRLEKDADQYKSSDQNLRIADLLAQYEKYLLSSR